MRGVGSFLWFLVLSLMALGYFVPDWVRLHEVIAEKDNQIKQFQQTAQQAEKDKQNALTTLHTANQNLQSCQQKVEQSNQTIVQLTGENTYLKEQNHQLVTPHQSTDILNANPQSQFRTTQSIMISGLISLIVLGVGSITAVGLNGLQKQRKSKRQNSRTGDYVYLTETEIKELIQQRRLASSNSCNHDLSR